MHGQSKEIESEGTNTPEHQEIYTMKGVRRAGSEAETLGRRIMIEHNARHNFRAKKEP